MNQACPAPWTPPIGSENISDCFFRNACYASKADIRERSKPCDSMSLRASFLCESSSTAATSSRHAQSWQTYQPPRERPPFFLRHRYTVLAHVTYQHANMRLPQRLTTSGLSASVMRKLGVIATFQQSRCKRPGLTIREVKTCRRISSKSCGTCCGAGPKRCRNARKLSPIKDSDECGGYGWTRTTDPSIMSAVL